MVLYDAALARGPVPWDTRWVETRYGPTHMVMGGPAHGRPVVLFHGAAVERARRRIPGLVSAEIVPKAGHLVTIAQPEWLRQPVFRFFDQGR